MPMLRGVLLVAVGGLALIGVAHAQTSPAGSNPEAAPIVGVPPVEVIGTTPLPGVGIDRDKVPANVQSVTSTDLEREGSPSLLNSLSDQAGSVKQERQSGRSLPARYPLSRLRGLAGARHAAGSRRLSERRPHQRGLRRYRQLGSRSRSSPSIASTSSAPIRSMA